MNIGKNLEKVLPTLSDFKWDLPDCRFLSDPIDLITFDGLSSNRVDSITFIEVKIEAREGEEHEQRSHRFRRLLGTYPARTNLGQRDCHLRVSFRIKSAGRRHEEALLASANGRVTALPSRWSGKDTRRAVLMKPTPSLAAPIHSFKKSKVMTSPDSRPGGDRPATPLI